MKLTCGKQQFSTLGIGLLWGVLLCVASANAQDVKKITYIDATELKHNKNNQYFSQLLALSLQYSQDKFGPYQLVALDTLISQSRQIKELNKDIIDVFWTMTTQQREDEARAIRIPLAHGIYGIRVLAINKKDKASFEQWHSAQPIANFTAIMGADWPDTAILRANSYPVNTEISEHNLYQLIASRQGYYFPRAVTEAWTEIAALPDNDVIVDATHLLVYPTAMYFFVAKNNTELAQRLEYGLNKIKENGEFDRLFYNFDQHRNALINAKFNERIIHQLNNPLLPASAPLDDIRHSQQVILTGSYFE